MTARVMYGFVAMAIAMIALAAFNVYVWADSRSAHAELNAERAARLTQREQDVKAQKVARVQSCVQSIPLLAIANRLISDNRADHYNRANQALALAKVDPTPELARIHRQAARQQRAKARSLEDFPSVTQAQCDRLATRLGVPKAKPIGAGGKRKGKGGDDG